MHRNTFLKLASVASMSIPFLSSLDGFAQDGKLKNWSGNLTYSTANVFYPKTVQEVQALVRQLSKARTLGTRHCFNAIADSKDNLISTRDLNKIISLDAKAKTVTVEGGIKYGELCPYLHEKGFALHNLASLPHISVAGSCTTATHGSGVKNANLTSAIQALEIVNAKGEIVQLSRAKDGDKFLAAAVGLGAFGVITKVTLAIQPTFLMRQSVYLQLPFSQLKDNFTKIMSAGYSVSLFTDWQGDTINEVWIKSIARENDDYHAMHEFYGAKLAPKNMHPIAELSAENCTEQRGVVGPWYERLPHFKMGFTPSSGKELQAEYFVPQDKAVDAIMAVRTIANKIGPHLFITEIRTIAADDFWMSPAYKQNSVAIHFTLKQEIPEVMALLPLIEQKLEPFGARPHWGKLFTLSPAKLASRYPKLAEFRKTVAEFDPSGKFRNDFLNQTIYG